MSKTETRFYTIVVYPIKGSTDKRAMEIAKKSGHWRDKYDVYEGAREAAHHISDLGGIRRVDIHTEIIIQKKHLIGAYSVGVYMRDAHQGPEIDYHHGSGRKVPDHIKQKKAKRK